MTDFLGLAFATPLSIQTEQVSNLVRTRDGSIAGTREGYPRWQVDITFEPRQFEDYQAELMAHRIRNGVTVPFTMKMPQVARHSSIGSSDSYDVRQAAGRGDSVIVIRPSSSKTIPEGRFIKFSNHSKVYMTDNVGYSGSDIVLNIVPDLVMAIATTHDCDPNPNLTCTYLENSGGFYQINRRSIIPSQISVIET